MKKKIKLTSSDSVLKKKLSQSTAYEIAEFVESLQMNEKVRLISLLGGAKQAEVFSFIEHDEAYDLLKLLKDDVKKNILNHLETDDLKDFLTEFDYDDITWIIPLLSEKKKLQMKSLLNYTEETAGSIMSLDYITLPMGLSIKDATAKVIGEMKETDYADSIFCVDADQKLIGILGLKELIIARKNDDINNLIIKEYVYADIDEDIDFVIEKVRNYDLKAIPVLDNQNTIKGIITADDILTELSESHDEDFNQFAMVNDFDEDDSITRRVIKRLPWLLVSVGFNLLIAMFISRFEDVIASIIALTLFQPMILGMAGNIGTQSLAATILGLNSKKITPGEKTRKHIGKELGVAVINSLLLGIAAFLLVFLFMNVLPDENEVSEILIGLTVGISIFVALTFSAIVSVFVPLGFNKIKVDPAVASGPIITTFNDIFALLVYFGTASIILISYLN